MSKIDPRLPDIYSSLYRVALKAVIVLDGKLLLTRERSGWYNLPGGGLDYGEEARPALLRELEEELDVRASDVKLSPEVAGLGQMGMLYNIPWLNVYYRAAISDSSVIKAGELQPKWVTKAELQTINLSPAIQADRDFLLAQLAAR